MVTPEDSIKALAALVNPGQTTEDDELDAIVADWRRVLGLD